VFGHIHEGYGQLTQGGTTYINASSLDRRYRPVNAPVVFDL
jgi:Icc-related predicted phosphoesterase